MKATVYEKKMNIPTYEVGKEEKNPMFFEKRVYQGSSGKVYPYPVTEKIFDEKVDKEYNAIILENDWLYVIVLPELGGRIYTAYDKTNNYDFVYHNRVIKPALVGLLGPWISGGIEFNWPQHHRPNTYSPVKYKLQNFEDGSVGVYVGETEGMFTLEQTTCIRLYPDKAFIEISTDIYNRGQMPQTFLWWANPAYRVNDYTRTIMPPDVSAVMDHGKRAVSEFPISRSEYYKFDYSAGVDISRYKNIQVPTSFMAYRSNFDFVGGYDYDKKAGLLHIADHHISPGKKQWTWGCGDFGQAWDRNLTDEDGPYVELMTGCFTDNQPDFTFIQPQERKSFTQYFMPYKQVGEIKNANTDFCFGTEGGELQIYSSICANVNVVVKSGDKVVIDKSYKAKPSQVENLGAVSQNDEIILTYNGNTLKFSNSMVKNFDIPSPATACPEPKECLTNDELYLYGVHIEQYRHATRRAEDYYLEGLARDASDVRINFAYGKLLLARGCFELAITHLQKAIDKSIIKNPNPIYTEAHYYCGMAHFYLGDIDTAYDLFYKCVWSNECKTYANFMLACISNMRKEYTKALAFANESIAVNNYNIRAYILKGNILLMLNDIEGAKAVFNCAQEKDALDRQSLYELQLLENKDCNALKDIKVAELICYVSDYFNIGNYAKAEKMLADWHKANSTSHPMVWFYIAYAKMKAGENANKAIDEAIKTAEAGAIHFPVNNFDIIVLKGIIDYRANNYVAKYYLGNLYYDKKQYDLACKYWQDCMDENSKFPTAMRNLSLYYYNKKNDKAKAVKLLEKAFSLDKKDSRILMELNSLYEITKVSEQDRLKLLNDNLDATVERDDLYIEYIRYIAHSGQCEKAYDMITNRNFHPWEGGEGKVTKLYKEILIALAKKEEKNGDYNKAIQTLQKAFNFPTNFGEGKLVLDGDNDIWYIMGEMAEKQGDAKAKEYYANATVGDATVADDMYYNDNPIDYIYYKALAEKKLGNITVAENIKQSMYSYFNKNLGKSVKIDYFAVSLPDLLIWEMNLDERNDNFCHYVKSLADKI